MLQGQLQRVVVGSGDGGHVTIAAQCETECLTRTRDNGAACEGVRIRLAVGTAWRLAGREYGTGSSRDWAAKGTALLGVRAVIAQSFERIHRSNLVGMGVLPLQFIHDGWQRMGLTGEEIVSIRDLEDIAPRKQLMVEIYRPSDGKIARFPVRCRIDTPTELEYFHHGGVLNFVLRNLAKTH